MPKPLKWIAILLGSLVAIVVIAVASLMLVSINHQNRVYTFTAAQLTLAAPGDLARGQHLVQVACVGCHGTDLGGQKFFDDAKMGQLWSRNLTKGDGGIGRTFTRADFVRAIRYGVDPAGHTLLFMPTNAFEHFSDEDLASIIVALDSVPPVDRSIPAPRVGPLARVLTVVAKGFPLFSAEQVEANAKHTMPPMTDTLAYGGYLAEVGGCHECHGATLGGGGGGAPNITSGGRLASWTEADFHRAIREGKRPDGTVISDQMPWKDMREITDAELHAIWTYVHSVPAVASTEQKK